MANLGGNVSSDSVYAEVIPMVLKGPPKLYKSTGSTYTGEDITYTEIPLMKDDTLQSLSIKFRCPVSEIKRVNGLYSDQEFFARTMIKIPVRSHQYMLQQELQKLAEKRASSTEDLIHKPSNCAADVVSSEVSDNEDLPSLNQDDDQELHDMENVSLLSDNPLHKSHKHSMKERIKYEKMLTRKDNSLKEIIEKVQKVSTSLTDDISLTEISISSRPQSSTPRYLNDTTRRLVCFLLILVCAVVLVCAIYAIVQHFEYLPSSVLSKPPSD